MEIVAVGTTCLVWNITKTPYPSNNHDTAAELAAGAQVLGLHRRLVPNILWDESTHALSMESMANGTLKDYVADHPDLSVGQRVL